MNKELEKIIKALGLSEKEAANFKITFVSLFSTLLEEEGIDHENVKDEDAEKAQEIYIKAVNIFMQSLNKTLNQNQKEKVLEVFKN